MDYMQNRLTDKEYADARRKEYESGLSKGCIRDRITERYLKLAAYEDACLTPSAIQEIVDVYLAVFHDSDPSTSLEDLMNRFSRLVNERQKLKNELDNALAEKSKLEAELSIAKEYIAAILWLNGNAGTVRTPEKFTTAVQSGSNAHWKKALTAARSGTAAVPETKE